MSDIELWRFVPGDCNPSEIGTRKGDFVDLGSNALFWNGPSFLLLDPSGLPKPKQSSSEAFDNIEMLRHMWLLVKMFQIVTFVLKI